MRRVVLPLTLDAVQVIEDQLAHQLILGIGEPEKLAARVDVQLSIPPNDVGPALLVDQSDTRDAAAESDGGLRTAGADTQVPGLPDLAEHCAAFDPSGFGAAGRSLAPSSKGGAIRILLAGDALLLGAT